MYKQIKITFVYVVLGKRYSTRFDFITQATTGPNPAGYFLESEYDSTKNCTNSQMFHPSSLIEEMKIPVFVSIFEMKKKTGGKESP